MDSSPKAKEETQEERIWRIFDERARESIKEGEYFLIPVEKKVIK